jgi:hypothetical protein
MRPPPIEKVVLLRDEMASLVWAVERIVPSAAGPGSTATHMQMRSLAHCRRAGARAGRGSPLPARLRRRVELASLHPVHVPSSNRSVRLQRARLRTRHRRNPRDPSSAGSLLDRRRSSSTGRKCRAPAASSHASSAVADRRTAPLCCDRKAHAHRARRSVKWPGL